MNTKPYNEESGKKQQVNQMFDRIAFRYDFLNRLLSVGLDQVWRKNTLNKLQNAPVGLLLDVATGTGDLAIAAYQKGYAKEVTGIDISQKMLDKAHEKSGKKQLKDHLNFLHGDAENLPFSDNTFDAITVAFGVRNFENLEKGIGEMWRVLKPGGQLLVLEFSKPGGFPFKQLFNLYFKYLLPLIGRWTAKDPKAYRYLYESVQTFPEGDAFLDFLLRTGFNQNQCVRLTFGVCSIYSGLKPSA